MVVDFEKLQPVEVVDIEEVFNIEMMVIGIESQRHMDTGSMAWEP